MSAPVVYTAQSKQFFYCRDAVCQFVFENNAIPLNPFRVFDYFLNDRVDRDSVRTANYQILYRSDELWVFGEVIADGVLVEIAQAAELEKPIRYFTIGPRPQDIQEVGAGVLDFEGEIYTTTGLPKTQLLHYIRQGRTREFAIALGRVSEVGGPA